MSAKSKHMLSKGLLKIAQQWQGDNLEGGREGEREQEVHFFRYSNTAKAEKRIKKLLEVKD